MAATGTPTPNLGLRIPQGTDPASVDDINYNSNLLDTKLGAVGNTSVQDQIDSLNTKITTVQISCTSLATLKENLLSLANSLNNRDTRFITFWVSGATEGFTTGRNYSGVLTISSKTSNTLFFDVSLSSYDGDLVIVGYQNGTWNINSLNSKAENIQKGTFYLPNAHCVYAGRNGWSGLNIRISIPIGKGAVGISSATINLGGASVYACTANSVVDITSRISSISCAFSGTGSLTEIAVTIVLSSNPLSFNEGIVNIAINGGTPTITFA